MGGLGTTEIAIILLIVIVLFLPKRIPRLGRDLGEALRSFKESFTETGRRESPNSNEK